MPKLWNTSKVSKIESKFDGTVYEFEPNEKKPIFYRDIINHLIYKLMAKGLVELPDDATPEVEKRLYISGIKRRRSVLKDVLVQYQTVNNERVAKKLGRIEPNQVEVDAVKEIRSIEEELTEIDGPDKEDRDMVKDYFQSEIKEKDVEATRNDIEDDGINQPKLKNEPE